MPSVCVPLAVGFEELEAITIIDVLRRAEVDVTTLAVASDSLLVRGSHEIEVRADQLLAAGLETAWDMVILPGGLPGATNLRDNPEVQQLIKTQHERGGRLAAICAAPIALGKAGVLAGKKATSYPGFEGELAGATCVSDRVVTDGKLVTSRGPGTALDFALELVVTLAGQATADNLRAGMLIES
jgi:4-methyl-5(b-hydroxyethyl)-thiazole monophosphate biosynthesis